MSIHIPIHQNGKLRAMDDTLKWLDEQGFTHDAASGDYRRPVEVMGAEVFDQFRFFSEIRRDPMKPNAYKMGRLVLYNGPHAGKPIDLYVDHVGVFALMDLESCQQVIL